MTIYNNIIKLFKNDHIALSTIMQILNPIISNYKTISITPNNKIILSQKEQIGGVIKSITINDNEYYYNIETGIPTDIKHGDHELYFITVNEGLHGCAFILFNKNTKQAIIQSISNYRECIVCSNPLIKYKVGDILMHPQF
jgi:hypothetical protein